jgi:hypothetical protein
MKMLGEGISHNASVHILENIRQYEVNIFGPNLQRNLVVFHSGAFSLAFRAWS